MNMGKCKYMCNEMYLFLLWIGGRENKTDTYSALVTCYDAILETSHTVSYSI